MTSDDLPTFTEPNDGRFGEPSQEQIAARCAAIRETWDAARWAKAVPERVVDVHHSGLQGRGGSDGRLLRRLLWTEDRPMHLKFGKRR